MNAPMNPNSSNKTQIPMATDISKRMGFNNFLRDVQGAAPTQPYVAPQMPTSMPQQQPMMPMMPPSSQAIRGGIGMQPMQPVQGFRRGGPAEDPIFAAVRANNEKARAEQAALKAYMDSQATAGPTPLEIAREGYLADQGSTPDMPTTLAEPVMPSEPTIPEMETMSVAPPTFSTGSPLPMANPNAGVAAPVTPPAVLGFEGDSGFLESDFYKNLPSFGTMDMYTASDGTEFSSGTTGRAYDQYLSSISPEEDFSPGDVVGGLPGLPPEGTGVMFQGDELTQDQVDRVTKQFNSNQIDRYGLETLMEANQGRMNRIINPIKKDKDAFYGRDADSTGKITSGKNRGQDSQALTNQIAMLNDPTRTGNILTDLQTAAKDPFGGLGDIGRSILDGSLFTPKEGQLFYKGGDDTPSAPPTQFSDANLNAMSDALGMEAFDALSGDQSAYQPYDAGEFVGINNNTISDSDVETLKRLNLDGNQSGILPSSDLGRLVGGDQQIANDLMKLLAVDPDKTNEDLLSTARTTLGPDGLREADPVGGGADNNPNQNFGSDTAPTITSDLISLGDSGVGGVSPNINIDDGVVTSSGVLPSSLLGRIVGQESDDNFGDFDEIMGALENNSTRLDMRDLRRQELKKLTAEVDALAEAQGIPKYKDNGFETREYKTLEDDYFKKIIVPRIMQGRGDILDEFREGYGPGSKVTIRDDAPVIGGVPQLGDLQNFDFTNQLQDRDMGGLGGNQVDLSGLPANVQGLPPSQLQLQDELNELKKSQVVDPEIDALMSGVTPEFNEDDYTAITGRGGLPSYSKSMVDALMGAGGEDLSKAREQARSQRLNEEGDLNISGTPFGESLEIAKTNFGPYGGGGTSGGSPNQFLENMGYGSRLNNPGEIGDYYVSGTDPEGNPVYRLKELEPRFNNLQVGPDGTLIDRFIDAQPEGALKGSIFDYVPDADQLGNFMRGIIGPAGASTIEGPNYAGIDLSGLPRTIQDLPASDASNYGVGVPTAIGGESAGGSISDLLDNIKSGEIGTTVYKDETIGILLPTNMKFSKTPFVGGESAFNLIDGSSTDSISGSSIQITNEDGSRTFVGQRENPEEFDSLFKQLARNTVNIPAGAKIVDNPNTGDTFELGEDLQDKKIDFFDDTQKPLEISLMSSDNPNNPFGQSAYNPNAVDLTKFMGGSGGLGSDMSPGTESNLLGDLGGFEQRFEDDTSIDSEIADLNNVSQLTDLTNLLTDSGLDAQTGNAISDTDAVEGLNILSSDSDQSSSSGDVLANILNTGDNAAAEATDSASGTAGSASNGDGEVGGGTGGLTDGDLDVIGDAIGEIAGGDASGSGTGSGDGSGSGSGDGGGGSGSGTGGTSTGGEGDGEGDDDGEGEGGGGTTITIPPSGGDSKKSKQERRDYSRLREILKQRARAPRGTAPGLGYKPVEGISNTLNKAADSFLDALKFG